MKLHLTTLCLLALACARCGGSDQDPAGSAGSSAPAPGASADKNTSGSGTSTQPGSKMTGGAALPGASAGATSAGGPEKSGCSTDSEPLLWKRGAALSNDLQQGLELPADQLCKELGQTSCTEVHRVPLGMDDPFGTGLYEAVQRPLATTALATDRIVLRACSNRVDQDKAGTATIFKDVNLSATNVTDADAKRVARIVYQRLLARDPSSEEIDVLRGLGKDPKGAAVSAADFAKLACFVVGTTTEFVLY